MSTEVFELSDKIFDKIKNNIVYDLFERPYDPNEFDYSYRNNTSLINIFDLKRDLELQLNEELKKTDKSGKLKDVPKKEIKDCKISDFKSVDGCNSNHTSETKETQDAKKAPMLKTLNFQKSENNNQSNCKSTKTKITPLNFNQINNFLKNAGKKSENSLKESSILLIGNLISTAPNKEYLQKRVCSKLYKVLVKSCGKLFTDLEIRLLTLELESQARDKDPLMGQNYKCTISRIFELLKQEITTAVTISS